ncbi:MAG: tetratricopeptide repeat protein [Cytophagales bacterium]|nr:tetratricopeptide repeat protein [Cytophagales bacterium]
MELLQEDPDDPFVNYCLAQEYTVGDEHQAQRYYETLLREHPGYLPTYYHAAHFFMKLGEEARVKALFEEGIRQAQAQNDWHALAELRSAKLNWEMEQE